MPFQRYLGATAVKKLLILTLFAVSALTQAGTVYKSVGPDGKTVYSDQPPDSGKVEKTLNFANLPSTPLPESVARYRDELEKSMKARLSEAQKPRNTSQPVLFVAQWCGYCRQAKRYLNEKKIAYMEHDIDTADGMRAMVESGGGKGVPVLLWNGQKISGFSPAAYDAVFRPPR